jgi:hypothetical protein
MGVAKKKSRVQTYLSRIDDVTASFLDGILRCYEAHAVEARRTPRISHPSPADDASAISVAAILGVSKINHVVQSDEMLHKQR